MADHIINFNRSIKVNSIKVILITYVSLFQFKKQGTQKKPHPGGH